MEIRRDTIYNPVNKAIIIVSEMYTYVYKYIDAWRLGNNF